MTTAEVTASEVVAWETERRARCGWAAVGAAVLTILGTVLIAVGLSDLPKYDARALSVIDTLGRASAGLPQPPGRLALQTIWIADHAALPLVGAVVMCIGTLLIFPALGFLFRATRARRPQLPQLALIAAVAGTVVYALARLAADPSLPSIARVVGAIDFRDGADHSNSAAADAVFGSPAYLIGQAILQLGAISLGFALVVICLNAMRVGLLSRFMGVLGIIVGVTVGAGLILPIDSQGIIRSFWLGALGLLLLGRWPSGMPKAWATGDAEPWPTQQQLREQRDAARAARDERGERSPPSAQAPAQPPRPSAPSPRPRRPDAAVRPHSSSKKRKRKRRS
jgi:hypothetical protein